MAVSQVGMMPPVKITGLLQARWANQVLKTALELDIFSGLSHKAQTAAELAAGLKLNAKAAGLLLDALAAMELLIKAGDKYQLTDLSAAYLVKDSELYLGTYILSRFTADAWEQLSNTIRTGKPQAKVDDPAQGEDFFVQLTAAIFPLGYTTAEALTAELKVAQINKETNVLDVGAGSGVWSLPMAQCNRLVHVDAVDFPAVLLVTKRFATKYGVDERYSYHPGSWREAKLQDDFYDFVILGHLLHSEGKDASRELLNKCHKAMKKGGTIVVAEFLQNNERSGPLFPSLFALNMLLATSSGCVFAETELKEMLEQAGFAGVKRWPLPGWQEQSPVIVARK